MKDLPNASEALLATLIQNGNEAFAEVTLSDENFQYFPYGIMFALLRFMYDMEIEINTYSFITVLETSYFDFEPWLIDPGIDSDMALRTVLHELNALIELDNHISLTVSELCDLVLKQSKLNQSNVPTDEADEYPDDGGAYLGRSMKLTGMRGWIKLHRQLLEHGWLTNHKLLALWLYLLLKASHKEHTCRVDVKRGDAIMTIEVLLKPGQLIFGRKVAARETGMSEQNVRTLMRTLEKYGSIRVQPTNSYSVVTITNWSHYQKPTIT